MAKGKHAPNKGALKQAEKVKKDHSFLFTFLLYCYFTSPHFITYDAKGASPWKQKSWQDCQKGNSSREY